MSNGSDAGPTNVWRRWTDARDIAFHDYCAVLPLQSERAGGNEEPGVKYCRTPTRTALRFTPLLVGLATVGFLVATLSRPALVGVDDVFHHYLQTVEVDLSTTIAVAFAAGILWLTLLIGILRATNLLMLPTLLKGLIVYGLVALLLSMAVFSVYIVTSDSELNPHATPETSSNVLFTSGFLLLLLLGGYFVYDGMLRTENMFWTLHEKRPSIVDDESAYEEFRDCFEEALESTPTMPLPERLPGDGSFGSPVRAAELFSIIFLLPFLAIGLSGDRAHPVITLVMGVFDFFLVVVFFQFLVLIKYFNELLRNHGPTASSDGFTLEYVPFHPDGYAGFRDFGRFSTRVNLLLVLGGLYLVFRLYVNGIPTVPSTTAPTMKFVSWAVNYLGGLVGYVLAVLLWLYFSFWQIHKTMRGGRSVSIEEMCDEGERNLEEYDLRNEAPVWPVNVRLFLSIVSLDIVPIAGSVLVLVGAG